MHPHRTPDHIRHGDGALICWAIVAGVRNVDSIHPMAGMLVHKDVGNRGKGIAPETGTARDSDDKNTTGSECAMWRYASRDEGAVANREVDDRRLRVGRLHCTRGRL